MLVEFCVQHAAGGKELAPPALQVIVGPLYMVYKLETFDPAPFIFRNLFAQFLEQRVVANEIDYGDLAFAIFFRFHDLPGTCRGETERRFGYHVLPGLQRFDGMFGMVTSGRTKTNHIHLPRVFQELIYG